MLRATSDAGKAAGDAVLVLSWIINVVSQCHGRLCKPCIQCRCCWQISGSISHPLSHAIPIFATQNMMRRNLPAEKRLTLDWRKARHFWLKLRRSQQTPWKFFSDWDFSNFPMWNADRCQIFMMWHAGLRGGALIYLESCGINLQMLASPQVMALPEGIALVLTLELGPWVDQELPGTKNKLRNATVLVIAESLVFWAFFFNMERKWYAILNLRWNLSVFHSATPISRFSSWWYLVAWLAWLNLATHNKRKYRLFFWYYV